jgi:hypothetical protein
MVGQVLALLFEKLSLLIILATQFWTETNIADGLNSLAICIEVHSYPLNAAIEVSPISRWFSLPP